MQSLQTDYLCRSFKTSIVKQLFSFATCILSREASRWDSRAARASVNINPALIGHLKHFDISQFDNLINSLYFTDNYVKINVTGII